MSLQHTVLIVDDEPGPRESLRMVLKPFFMVEVVDNGASALDIIKKKKIDFVTLDLTMPGLGGVDVLQKIKAMKPEIEVLIITGYGSFKTALEGLRYGACDYLIKPFNISDIKNITQQVINRKKKREELQDLLKEISDTPGIQKHLGELSRHYSEICSIREKR